MIGGVIAHAGVEFRTGVRDRSLLLMTYLFPLGFYVFMGLFMTQMNPDFATVMIAGMTVLATLSAGMFSIPGPMISARETGVLRSYQVNGVPGGAVFGVPLATTVLHLLVVGAVVAVTAPVFDAEPVVNYGAFTLVLAVAAAVHSALGALIGVVSTNSRVSVLWSQLLFLPSMMLAGIVVPLSQLPEAFRPVSFFIPATYVMEAFQGLAMGAGSTVLDPWAALGVLVIGAVLAVVLTRLCYSWDEHGSGRRIHPAFAVLAMAPYVVVGLVLALQ